MIHLLELDQKFEKTLFENLRAGNYFTNEIINALRIAVELKKEKSNNAFLAPMQSGKTGTIKHLCNLILPNIDLVKEDESILFLTSMRDKDLKDQNIRSLEGYESNIFVMPMHKFKSHGIVEIEKLNVKLIVRDEDQYGCAKESSFDISFFSNVRKLIPDLPLLSVSATPFDILDARVKGMDVEVIHGLRHENYFGITEMLKENMIIPLEEKYEHFQVQDDKTLFSEPIRMCIKKLNHSEKGFGIIRCSTTAQAVELKNQLSGLDKNTYETIVIGCKEGADYPIQEGLNILPRKLRVEKKKIILLVIHALSAGKDLKKLKNEVRFIIETRKSQFANCVQGLPGRVCGYHENRDVLIFANKSILEHYSDFENEPEIYNDSEWINELHFDNKVKSLSTQIKLHTSQREGLFIPIKQECEIPVEELFSEVGENILSFLTNEEYKTLLKYFEKETYQDKIRIGGLKNKHIQLRISSNYRKYNNVFRSWSKTEGDNYKSIFNHKNEIAKYGLLISNYPVGDSRNKIGFCGVKLFLPGKQVYLNNLSRTFSTSMYLDESEEENI